MTQATQDQFLGGLLGLAIGDALGMPVAGWPADRIRERFGSIDGYRQRTLADGTVIGAGEFTDESETALCVVESLTTNRGVVDVENIGARMIYLARGESRRWQAEATSAALDRADETAHFVVPLDEDGPVTADVATRAVPIGLLHAVGAFAPAAFRSDIEQVVRITHGSPAAIAAATAVAYGVYLAATGDVAPAVWAGQTADFLGHGELADRLRAVREATAVPSLETESSANELIAAAFGIAAGASSFDDAVLTAVNRGGAADTRGALVGALKGAQVGVSGIPQHLIDGLEGRLYVSLAAPWFFRAAQQRAGLVIDLNTTN